MSVPTDLRSFLLETFKVIVDDPDHEFGPNYRMKLGEKWSASDIPEGDLAYRFLDVLSAEKTIEIYESQPKAEWVDNWYHREMARRLTQIAKAILVEKIPYSVGFDLATSNHYTIGNMDDVLPCNAYMALVAANTALLACSKQQSPPDDFDVLSKITTVGVYKVDTHEKVSEESATGKQFTDLTWAKHGSSDTAAAAAIAWSCSQDTYTPDPEKLLEFWAWWFNTAIPEAWQMAGYSE